MAEIVFFPVPRDLLPDKILNETSTQQNQLLQTIKKIKTLKKHASEFLFYSPTNVRRSAFRALHFTAHRMIGCPENRIVFQVKILQIEF